MVEQREREGSSVLKTWWNRSALPALDFNMRKKETSVSF